EVEVVLEPHEVGPLRRRDALPGASAGRLDDDVLHPAGLEPGPEERLGQRRAAGVAGADQQDPGHGARVPTRRRSSRRGIAPSRTSWAAGPVQSTIVEGGTFPRGPPSSTRSSPAA